MTSLYLFIKKIFYWSIVDLQCCVSFLLYSKVNQSYVYIYPLFFRFPSHLGPYISFRVIIAICNFLTYLLTQEWKVHNCKDCPYCALSPVISIKKSSHLSIAYNMFDTVLTLTTIQWVANVPVLQKRNLKYREVQ